jgi:signal transduction histidine kinase
LRAERQLRRETEELKSDFFAMAVHDLKQPVTILKAVHQLLAEAAEEAGGALKKSVGRVAYLSLSSVDRLNSMIEDMLSIARLSSPEIPVEKERLVLRDFLKKCAAEYEPAVASASKRWSFDAAGLAGGWWIYADADLLRRLVGNLVLNAVHYTPDGGAVRLGGRLRKDGRAEIFVSDEGVGIPEGFRTEIFRKFSTLSKSARNVGLGLAFCKIVADRHSALLDVRSEEGKGTEFSLIIPVSAGSAPAD